MPKQLMTVRNKLYRGPGAHRWATPEQTIHAFQRGYDAWERFGKPITDNPYRPGQEHDAWNRGYIQATEIKWKAIPNRAPEGLAKHKNSVVVVKNNGVTKTHKPRKEKKDDKGKEIIVVKHSTDLGYVSKDGRLRRFNRWTGNPKDQNWNKTTGRSELHFKLRKEKWLKV
jgi:hypothetical protein